MRVPSLPPPLRLRSGGNVNGSILRHMSSSDSDDVTIGEAAMVHMRAEAGGAECGRTFLLGEKCPNLRIIP